MNKLLILSAMVLLLPVVPALACFPDDSEEVLFASEGHNFDRNPLPMSYCESGEVGFVIVNGRCYDFDAITDYDTEEECQADPVCKTYREDQKKVEVEAEEPFDPGWCPVEEAANCDGQLDPDPDPIGDPNHGEIKGDEELAQDEEEHQEEEEQGEEESEQTTQETAE